MNDVITTIKVNVLVAFKYISEALYSGTESFRHIPTGVDSGTWTNYFMWILVMFLIPVIVAVILSVGMDVCVVYAIKCYHDQEDKWKARKDQNQCFCSLISECMQIFIFLLCAATAGLMCFTYFDFSELSQVVFWVTEQALNTTEIPVTPTSSLTESSAGTYLIVFCIVFCVVYCIYAIVTVVQVFTGYYCACGKFICYLFCSGCLTYFGVIIYAILGGAFMGFYFFNEDVCHFQASSLRQASDMFQGIYSNGSGLGALAAWSGDFLDVCITPGNSSWMNSTDCNELTSRLDSLWCQDGNYFFSGGIGLVSLLIALCFFGLYWAVCWNLNLVRAGDSDVSRVEEEYERMAAPQQSYYFEDNDDLDLDYYDDM